MAKYDIKCWICGGKATKKRDLKEGYFVGDEIAYMKPLKNEHQRCYCDECFKKEMKRISEENKTYIRLKKRRMFETAIDKLEHQKINIYKYKDAIQTIQEYFDNNLDKFDSSDEVMAAIMLIHNHIPIKPQAKVGRYQVDFMLTDDHIILEIDGDRHKGRKYKDNERDVELKYILGDDWEIIHIPTECIEKDATKIVTAIEKVLDYRYKLS